MCNVYVHRTVFVLGSGFVWFKHKDIFNFKMAPGRRRDRSSVNPCLKYFIFLFNFVFLVSRPREIMVFVSTVRVFCSVRITLVFSEFSKLLCCNDRHCDCESSSTLYSQTGVVDLIHGWSQQQIFTFRINVILSLWLWK